MPEPTPAGPILSQSVKIVNQNADALIARRQQELAKRSLGDKVVDAISSFSGSTPFLTIHILWFGVWLLVNTGRVGMRPFDPFPYGLLTLIVSLEAIFLSTILLISSNRQSKLAEERANLDLHINLLAEHEICRILRLVDCIAERMGIEEAFDPETEGLEQDTRIEDLLAELRDR